MTKHTEMEVFKTIRIVPLRRLIGLHKAWEAYCQEHPDIVAFGGSHKPYAQWVMDTLKCNRRTAYDYIHTLEILFGEAEADELIHRFIS